MKKVIICVGLAVAGLASQAGVAHARPEIIVPIDDIEAGPIGSTVIVGTADVEPEFQGIECIATAVVYNQESAHPNNDLIITSGGNTVEVPNVESASFETRSYMLPIVLGSTVTVSLRFGSDEYFSGGIEVQFDCVDNIPSSSDVPTTTESPATTATATTQPAPSSSVPQPAPTDVIPASSEPDSSTIPPVDATTVPPGPNTTTPGAGTPPPTLLPATGSNTDVSLAALVLVLLGAGALLVARRTPDTN